MTAYDAKMFAFLSGKVDRREDDYDKNSVTVLKDFQFPFCGFAQPKFHADIPR